MVQANPQISSIDECDPTLSSPSDHLVPIGAATLLDESRSESVKSPALRKQPRPVTPHGILVEQLATTVAIAQQAAVPDHVLASLQQVQALAAGLDPYLAACTTAESPALAALARRTAAEDWRQRVTDQSTAGYLEQEMLSGHLEGQTLQLFVHMMRAKRILEIGMFTGYSALAMAEALPADGCLVACEVDPYAAEFARSCFAASPHGSKIQVKVAPALQTLAALAAEQQSFDLAFVDADKTEYVAYFQYLLNHDLVVPGGFICVDNTLLQGQPYLPAAQQTANGAAIADFNRVVADDPRVEQVLLPLRDGLTIIRRKPQ